MRSQSFDVVGFNLHRTLECLLRLWEARLARQDEAQIHERLCILGIVLYRLAEQLFRFTGLALASVEHAKIVLSLGILRVQRNRALELRLSLCVLRGLQAQEAQLIVHS